MTFLATDMALEELNKNGIDVTDVMMDRAIILNKGNPLEKLFNVIVEMDGKDKTMIRHPFDKDNAEFHQVIFLGNKWIWK